MFFTLCTSAMPLSVWLCVWCLRFRVSVCTCVVEWCGWCVCECGVVVYLYVVSGMCMCGEYVVLAAICLSSGVYVATFQHGGTKTSWFCL